LAEKFAVRNPNSWYFPTMTYALGLSNIRNRKRTYRQMIHAPVAELTNSQMSKRFNSGEKDYSQALPSRLDRRIEQAAFQQIAPQQLNKIVDNHS